jgi:N4-gp56 family major capsid protein
MTLNSVIPQVWSAKLLMNLNDTHVYADLLTREYEGEIKRSGDSVRINTIGRVNISTYDKNTTTLTRETLNTAAQVLIVDRSHYFDFEVDDIDAAQQNPKVMGAFTAEAAWGFSDVIDSDIASVLAAGAGTTNDPAAAVGTGAGDDDAYEVLVDLGVSLTEQNVPKGARWVVVPPWFEGMLLKDPRFVSFGTDKNGNVLVNGQIGRAAGFDIRVSNNVPVSSSDYTIIAGVKSAAAYAEQLNEVEPFRPHDGFSDALKGLLLYGRKVIDPSRLVKVVATQA